MKTISPVRVGFVFGDNHFIGWPQNQDFCLKSGAVSLIRIADRWKWFCPISTRHCSFCRVRIGYPTHGNCTLKYNFTKRRKRKKERKWRRKKITSAWEEALRIKKYFPSRVRVWCVRSCAALALTWASRPLHSWQSCQGRVYSWDFFTQFVSWGIQNQLTVFSLAEVEHIHNNIRSLGHFPETSCQSIHTHTRPEMGFNNQSSPFRKIFDKKVCFARDWPLKRGMESGVIFVAVFTRE